MRSSFHAMNKSFRAMNGGLISVAKWKDLWGELKIIYRALRIMKGSFHGTERSFRAMNRFPFLFMCLFKLCSRPLMFFSFLMCFCLLVLIVSFVLVKFHSFDFICVCFLLMLSRLRSCFFGVFPSPFFCFSSYPTEAGVSYYYSFLLSQRKQVCATCFQLTH